MLADKEVWHSTQELRLVRARYADTLQAVEWLGAYLANAGYNRQASQILWYGESMAKSATAHLDAIAEKDSIASDGTALPGADKLGANGHGTPAGTTAGEANEKGAPHADPGLLVTGPDPETDVELIDKRLNVVIAIRASIVREADAQTWEVAVKFLREAKSFAIAAEQQRRFAIGKLQAAENVLKGLGSE